MKIKFLINLLLLMPVKSLILRKPIKAYNGGLELGIATLGTGILITGGGSYLNGSRDLAQKVFNIPCLYGKPIDVHGLTSSQESSKYSSLIGSIRYINTLEKKIDNPSIIQRILNLIWGKS